MRRRGGFALVSSLIIMVVLMVMGLGAMFLTDMNLKIAENGRTSAIARYNAEAGLDSAFVVLAGAFKANDALPDDLPAFRAAYPDFENDQYVFAPSNGYTLFADGSARVRIQGLGPRNARYEAEALIQPVLVPTDGPTGTTLFGEGFVARESITMNGNGTYDTNFWSGGNVDLKAGTLMAGRIASAAGDKCRFKDGGGTCLTNQPPPDVPLPVFSALRDQVIANAEEDFPLFDMAACPTVSGTYGGSNNVVCVAPGQTLTLSGNVRNLVVIGDATTTVRIDATTGDTTDDLVNGVTVASGTVTFGGSSAFYGPNSIFAVNNISFGQNVVTHDDTARTFIATEGDFTLNGAGTSNIYASFWVGGMFTVNGTGDEFRATVVSNEAIIKNGAGSFSTVSSPRALDNEYVPADPDPEYAGVGVRVLSRR